MITTRQSAPPGPPDAFDPNRTPSGVKNAQELLEAEHLRLRPEERHRQPTAPGSPLKQIVPPMNLGLPAHTQKLSNYPAFRFHRIKAPTGIICQSAEDEKLKCAGEGWSEFPPAAQAKQSLESRLELLETLIESLSTVANPEESPVEALDRIISERDEFARKAASKTKEK